MSVACEVPDLLDYALGDDHSPNAPVAGHLVTLATEFRASLNTQSATGIANSLSSALRRARLQPNSQLPGVDLRRLFGLQQGNCVELSLVCVLLGRQLNLPIRAVRVPRHMFVRIRCGDEFCNLETMDPARRPADAEYASEWGVNDSESQRGVFLADLSDEELLSELIHKRRYGQLSQGDRIGADLRRELRLALKLHPRGIDMCNTIGMNLCLRGRPSHAIRVFRDALNVAPDYLPLLNNLIEALTQCGDFSAARDVADRCMETADVLRVEGIDFLRNAARAFLRCGEYSRAAKIYKLLHMAFQKTKWPPQQQLIAPYEACLNYWSRDYEASARIAIDWARLGKRSELGAVWALSAYRQLNDQCRIVDLVESWSWKNPFYKDVALMFAGVATSEELKCRYKLESASIDAFAGEYWSTVDMNRAVRHWQTSLPQLSPRSFTELRVFRNLKDHR